MRWLWCTLLALGGEFGPSVQQYIARQAMAHAALVSPPAPTTPTATDTQREIRAVDHDEWCPINGCRCGKCGPCIGPPTCVPIQPTATDEGARGEGL